MHSIQPPENPPGPRRRAAITARVEPRPEQVHVVGRRQPQLIANRSGHPVATRLNDPPFQCGLQDRSIPGVSLVVHELDVVESAKRGRVLVLSPARDGQFLTFDLVGDLRDLVVGEREVEPREKRSGSVGAVLGNSMNRSVRHHRSPVSSPPLPSSLPGPAGEIPR